MVHIRIICVSMKYVWFKKSILGQIMQGCNKKLHLLLYIFQITANFKTDNMIFNLMTTIYFSASKTIHTYSVAGLFQKIINQCFWVGLKQPPRNDHSLGVLIISIMQNSDI